VTERTLAATVHGRYLVQAAAAPDAPVLAGFHGYAESAEIQMERQAAVPGSEQWLRISVQALHPFYQRRTDTVVASWMTRQDRELAIADNIRWVQSAIESARQEHGGSIRTVYAGFSQGVATAFRSAAHAPAGTLGVIAAGSDIPPELTPEELHRIPAVLLARGLHETWYTAEKLAADLTRLKAAGVRTEVLEFEGGHEWGAALNQAAGKFLTALLR
jgi:predicted esterase